MQRKLNPEHRLLLVEGLAALSVDLKHKVLLKAKAGDTLEAAALAEKRDRVKNLRELLLTRGNCFVIDC